MGDTPSSIIDRLSFFAQPPLSEHPSLSLWTAFADVFVYIWWMIGFLDTGENVCYFLFILFVSYVRVFTYVRELVTPTGQGFPPPFFLGVAIGLELKIRL